jgi:hypothetical protein
VTGGGISPIAGLRLGAGLAHGVYREQTPGPPIAINRQADATVFNLEGEYAIGYTRIAGEWILDRFENANTPAIARGYLVEAVQTLTPRWYIAARMTQASTPSLSSGAIVRRSAGSADGTVGFRVSPDITLKAGYQGSRSYTRSDWDHAAAVSIVFGKRLF